LDLKNYETNLKNAKEIEEILRNLIKESDEQVGKASVLGYQLNDFQHFQALLT
jgi:hypothetical protein